MGSSCSDSDGRMNHGQGSNVTAGSHNKATEESRKLKDKDRIPILSSPAKQVVVLAFSFLPHSRILLQGVAGSV